jgi:hypothetical protein
MNQSEITIPILDFEEAKFEPAILLLKTGLKSAERHQPHINRSGKSCGLVRKECVSPDPLVQSFRPRPPRSLKYGAKRPVGKSEIQSRK